MDTVPVHVTANFPIMGLIVFGMFGLGFLFVVVMILRTLTGRSHRTHHSDEAGVHGSHPRSVLAPVLLGLGLLVAGVVMVGFLTLGSYKMQKASTSVTGPHEADFGTVESRSDAAGGESEETDETSAQLPLWTKKKQTVIATGEVPRVLFVETSGLYSTQEEAMAEAMKNAISNFKSRLAETWSKLAVQPVPENIFREASIQQVYTEKRIHSFGAYDEPMYRVYLQYIDSAEAREPVIEAWKGTFAGNRAMQFGIGFGVLTALLGVVSAGLRAVSAAKGSRGRAVMTALAFAGLGLVGLIFVA